MLEAHIRNHKALVIEPEHSITPLITEMGYECTRLHPKECARGAGGPMTSHVKRGDFKLLWICLKRRNVNEQGAQLFRAAIATMCLWIRMLSEQGNFAVVIGRTGDHWSETQFQRMLEEGHLHESKHHLCHFGEKLNKDGGDPSMVCFKALSTQPLP